MELKIQKKIERFIELSTVFSKSQEDIFGEEKHNQYTITGMVSNSYVLNNNTNISGREIIIGEDNILRAVDDKPLTKSEKILAEAKIEAKLSDDFDEYIELQKDLEEYFKINNKLTQQ